MKMKLFRVIQRMKRMAKEELSKSLAKGPTPHQSLYKHNQSHTCKKNAKFHRENLMSSIHRPSTVHPPSVHHSPCHLSYLCSKSRTVIAINSFGLSIFLNSRTFMDKVAEGAQTESSPKGCLPYFSCKYGEDTKLGISLKRFDFTVHALPQQGKALVRLL
jgi:hypothetical protein